MLLNTICNSKVYHENTYYLLGLQVGMTGRKMKRRIEDLETANEMGEADWTRAYDQFLLGSASAPSKERFDELAERIKDPEFAVTEAFFWFWPTNESSDPALEAIANGDRASAANIWRGLAKKSSREATIARHNLAILLHYYAIDAENQYLAGRVVKSEKDFLVCLDRFWHSAFEYWEALVDDDDFWDAFADRVKAVDDPRLGSSFVEEFRRQFPISFDNINADFMVAYARSGKFEDAKRHFKYMCETMSDSDDVDETLKSAFKPQIDKLNLQIKHCKESKNDADGLKDVQSVLNASKDLFKIFEFLLPPKNRMYVDLRNDIASCRTRLILYVKKSEDFEGALLVSKDLLGLAIAEGLKSEIRKDIAWFEDVINKRREADTCWYCKTYRKGTPKRAVKMYADVLPDPDRADVLGVKYSIRTIQVPVCSKCSSKFSEWNVHEYPPIKRSLADGWKVGSGPSDAEIQAVWRDLALLIGRIAARRGY